MDRVETSQGQFVAVVPGRDLRPDPARTARSVVDAVALPAHLSISEVLMGEGLARIRVSRMSATGSSGRWLLRSLRRVRTRGADAVQVECRAELAPIVRVGPDSRRTAMKQCKSPAAEMAAVLGLRRSDADLLLADLLIAGQLAIDAYDTLAAIRYMTSVLAYAAESVADALAYAQRSAQATARLADVNDELCHDVDTAQEHARLAHTLLTGASALAVGVTTAPEAYAVRTRLEEVASHVARANHAAGRVARRSSGSPVGAL